MAYYVLLDGSQEGPYEIATVDRLVREGRLDRETYVWTAGMADWAFADSVPEIAALLRAAAAAPPPPLPPEEPPRAAPPPPAADSLADPLPGLAPPPRRLSIARALGDGARVLFQDPIRTAAFGGVFFVLLAACTPTGWALLLDAAGVRAADLGPELEALAAPHNRARAMAAGSAAGFALVSVLWGGLCASALAMVRGEAARTGLLFAGVPRLFALVGFSILAAAACSVGFALLVLPGVFLLVCLALGPFAAVDGRAGPLAAAAASFRLVMRLGWLQCFGALLAAGILVLAALGGLSAALGLTAALDAGGWTGAARWEGEFHSALEDAWFAAWNPPAAIFLAFLAGKTLALLFAAGVLASMYDQAAPRDADGTAP